MRTIRRVRYRLYVLLTPRWFRSWRYKRAFSRYWASLPLTRQNAIREHKASIDRRLFWGDP